MEQKESPARANVRTYLDYLINVKGARSARKGPLNEDAINYVLVLGSYNKHKWVDARALGILFGKSPSSVHETLKRLIDEKMLEKTEDQRDHRKKNIKTF